MNHSKLIPLHLVLILSTAIIITARPNILQYERIRKYRYSVGEGTTSKSSQEPLIHSSATYKTTTSLYTTTTTTITEAGNDHHNQERLYKSNSIVGGSASPSINHISYDDFINLTCQEEHEENHGPSTTTTNSCYLHDDDSSSNASTSSSQSHNNHDNHTNTNKLHRTFLRIPTTISASKVILESEELNEDHLFESYIYS
ncbi:hypothetical protein NAEGRDRAFT_78522 [Naegleria gruberi]|uniref:Uncharacterized protein n=1 Tax=Naegleria gruberi TaxID=5762 RepID=D2V4C9_NAEGR|nr:uncharacterized protein NAEGRDRAFT_78522 [Naegleria gruberi]EFC48362.1 hypothetical protein NAEGRDRAFT_78522 [Naegleria gruberi]|eukprot:XP_002681106.1 hypothetical protein NAEGRDRAFT_78522 [Naegleria gruberi strain NEG-M]